MTATWITPAPSAVPRTRRMATASQAYFQSKRAEATYSFAQSIAPTQSVDGLAQAETRQAYQERLLLARRMALIGTARHLRNQMRCSEASSVTDELRTVTNAILAQGAP